MEIKTYLTDFINKKCACGKSHKINLPEIIVGKNALSKVPEFIEKFGGGKAFVLADVNTFEVAGKKLIEVLESSKISYSKHVFSKKEIEPDEEAVGSAVMHFDHSCNIVIAVGSGVINDIGKILSATANKPYFIVGTAPSMDGYASATSSVSMDGVKTSLPSKCADVIIGDIEVLKNAPERMLQAGIGDMLAKYISIAEWRIANEITGEYYCGAVASLIRNAVKRCVDNANGLLARNEGAIKAVFEGLIIGGVAMAIAGCSRPASGIEHYFSHVWDMRGLEFGTKVELHGLQCAVGTYISAKLYEKVLKITPDKEKALNYVKAFDYSCWENTLSRFLGKIAKTMAELEKKEGKYDVCKHGKRLETIISKWDEICLVIKEEIPSTEELDKLFETIKLCKSAKEMEIDADLYTTFCATKDIRDKYVLSRLLWDLGEIEDFKRFLTNE